MAIEKPDTIRRSTFKSAKWDELTEGRAFRACDAPVLALLCQWYEVIEQCMDDLACADGIRVSYQNDLGDIKAYPQLSTMKQASAEIRALNKQLGIDDEAQPETRPKETKLHAIQTLRGAKASRSTRTA